VLGIPREGSANKNEEMIIYDRTSTYLKTDDNNVQYNITEPHSVANWFADTYIDRKVSGAMTID